MVNILCANIVLGNGQVETKPRRGSVISFKEFKRKMSLPGKGQDYSPIKIEVCLLDLKKNTIHCEALLGVFGILDVILSKTLRAYRIFVGKVKGYGTLAGDKRDIDYR